MIKLYAALPLIILFACSSGPDEVDASLFDAGDLVKDSGEDPNDGGPVDTGTIAGDASQVDGDVGDGDLPDGDPRDGDLLDGEPNDGEATDGETPDGGVDGGDAGVDPDGAVDGGPLELVEDFTDPVNEIFTCPDNTAVMPGLDVENGTQCLGIDGSGCPDARGLPGPGAVECSDPNHNPFIGVGQCVSDFFSCFDPMGACANDGAGTFTWGNGARQVIQVDGNGRLIQSEFFPSTSATPCVVAMPETPGGTIILYTRP